MVERLATRLPTSPVNHALGNLVLDPVPQGGDGIGAAVLSLAAPAGSLELRSGTYSGLSTIDSRAQSDLLLDGATLRSPGGSVTLQSGSRILWTVGL